MAGTVSSSAVDRQVLLSDLRATSAKGGIRKADLPDWKADVGRAVERAVTMLGWSLKEFSVAVGRDERQCKRWFTGEDRPQLDVIFAVEALRQPLVICLAELAERDTDVWIDTVITLRRRRV